MFEYACTSTTSSGYDFFGINGIVFVTMYEHDSLFQHSLKKKEITRFWWAFEHFTLWHEVGSYIFHDVYIIEEYVAWHNLTPIRPNLNEYLQVDVSIWCTCILKCIIWAKNMLNLNSATAILFDLRNNVNGLAKVWWYDCGDRLW